MATNAGEQHDDHCWIKAEGRMCFIVCIHKGMWLLHSACGIELWDMREFDTEQYVQRAVFQTRLMNEPIDEDER